MVTKVFGMHYFHSNCSNKHYALRHHCIVLDSESELPQKSVIVSVLFLRYVGQIKYLIKESCFRIAACKTRKVQLTPLHVGQALKYLVMMLYINLLV